MKLLDIQYSQRTDVLPFSNERISNLILLDVQSNEQSIPFVFDTGAMMTTISESVAEKLGARFLDKTLKGGGNAGGNICGRVAIIETLQVGSNIIKNKKVGVIPNAMLQFGKDDEGNEIIVHGFLGWDIIKHFKWTIHSVAKTITLEKSVEANVQRNMSWDIQPLIHVGYKNEKLYFGFDSGNTEGILGPHFLSEYNNSNKVIDSFAGIDGTKKEQVTKADQIKLVVGEHSVYLKNISIIDREVFPSKYIKVYGLLAADLIQNKVWSIDYKNRHFKIIK